MNLDAYILTFTTILYIINIMFYVNILLDLSKSNVDYTAFKYIFMAVVLQLLAPIVLASITHNLAPGITNEYFIIIIIIFALTLIVGGILSILALYALIDKIDQGYIISTAVISFVLALGIIIYGWIGIRTKIHVP